MNELMTWITVSVEGVHTQKRDCVAMCRSWFQELVMFVRKEMIYRNASTQMH